MCKQRHFSIGSRGPRRPQWPIYFNPWESLPLWPLLRWAPPVLLGVHFNSPRVQPQLSQFLSKPYSIQTTPNSKMANTKQHTADTSSDTVSLACRFPTDVHNLRPGCDHFFGSLDLKGCRFGGRFENQRQKHWKQGDTNNTSFGRWFQEMSQLHLVSEVVPLFNYVQLYDHIPWAIGAWSMAAFWTSKWSPPSLKESSTNAVVRGKPIKRERTPKDPGAVRGDVQNPHDEGLLSAPAKGKRDGLISFAGAVWGVPRRICFMWTILLGDQWIFF